VQTWELSSLCLCANSHATQSVELCVRNPKEMRPKLNLLTGMSSLKLVKGEFLWRRDIIGEILGNTAVTVSLPAWPHLRLLHLHGKGWLEEADLLQLINSSPQLEERNLQRWDMRITWSEDDGEDHLNFRVRLETAYALASNLPRLRVLNLGCSFYKTKSPSILPGLRRPCEKLVKLKFFPQSAPVNFMHHLMARFPKLQEGVLDLRTCIEGILPITVPEPTFETIVTTVKYLYLGWFTGSAITLAVHAHNRDEFMPAHVEVEGLEVSLGSDVQDLSGALVLFGPALKCLKVRVGHVKMEPDHLPVMIMPRLITLNLEYLGANDLQFATFSHMLRGAPNLESLCITRHGGEITVAFMSAMKSLNHLQSIKITENSAPADFFTQACGAWPALRECSVMLERFGDAEAALLIPFLDAHPSLNSLEIETSYLSDIALPAAPQDQTDLGRAWAHVDACWNNTAAVNGKRSRHRFEKLAEVRYYWSKRWKATGSDDDDDAKEEEEFDSDSLRLVWMGVWSKRLRARYPHLLHARYHWLDTTTQDRIDQALESWL
jgi:hypothetical protein